MKGVPKGKARGGRDERITKRERQEEAEMRGLPK